MCTMTYNLMAVWRQTARPAQILTISHQWENFQLDYGAHPTRRFQIRIGMEVVFIDIFVLPASQ